MYWRIKNLSPEYLMRKYGVHALLGASLLLNVFLIVTRPQSRGAMTGEMQVSFEQFARQVTSHLLDTSYITFPDSVQALQGELDPSVLRRLQAEQKLPPSDIEMRATVRQFVDTRRLSAIRIDSVELGDPNEKGLVPAQVTGVVAVLSAAETGPSDPVPFRFLYLLGVHPDTGNPMVATLSE